MICKARDQLIMHCYSYSNYSNYAVSRARTTNVKEVERVYIPKSLGTRDGNCARVEVYKRYSTQLDRAARTATVYSRPGGPGRVY
jgi:hypothetical protein